MAKLPELDGDLIHKIAIKVLEKGLRPKVAARSLCVSNARYARWEKRGQDLQNEEIDPEGEHDALCLRLVVAVEIAEADYEEELLRLLREAKHSDWTKYQTLLERRFPERHAKLEQKAKKDLAAESPDEFYARMEREDAAKSKA
jgi:hypothetical protein